jgi:oligoendopeptidase F
MDKKLYKPFKYTGKAKFKYSVYVKGENGKSKKISFGDSSYSDFRQHKDEKRRKAYLARAKGIKNKQGQLTWKNKNTKNYWAIKYLWDG